MIKAIEITHNKKTGPCSATYAPIQSCPTDCPFLDSGCYAQSGPCAIHLNRLNTAAEKYKRLTPLDIAKKEAKAIDKLSGLHPLRLHVTGDCRTESAARIVAAAAQRYTDKHGSPVWTYTHAWKHVERRSWGNVSVLASCETIEEVKQAHSNGYASAMVSDAPNQTAAGFHLSQCYTQVTETNCLKCRRCFVDLELHRTKTVITFKPHGSQKKKVAAIVAAKNSQINER